MKQREFIHGLEKLDDNQRACVATIGSFDGVHLGHQAVLQQASNWASKLSLPLLVMVFEPQPSEYFSPKTAPARLMRLREKVLALFDQGVDKVLCLKFNSQLRGMTAEEFIERVLVRYVGVKALVVGDDFRFGCDRSGDFSMLKRAGEYYSFDVEDTHTYAFGGERVSSTRIRQLLGSNKLSSAANNLGRPYSVFGRVVYGRQLGRSLGFPTVNIGLGRYRSPVSGVYSVFVETMSNDIFKGVANVGVRPTLGGAEKPMLEVHLFNVNKNFYGQFLKVIFKEKIREEQHFDSLETLKKQVIQDVETAKEMLIEMERNNKLS